jgi:hypothetical protein
MPREFKIRSFDFQSRTDMKVRQTSGYGDNAMEDPTATNESVESDIDQLRGILNKAKVTDEMIIAGASLTDRGFEKAAAALGLSAKEVRSVLDSLREHLKSGGDEQVLGESVSPRYSWEHDGLGNVTVRDSKTGDEQFYGGSKGFAILSAVKNHTSGGPEEQAFLASYCEKNLNESLAEDEIDEDEIDEDEVDFMGEISAEVSTFNFPWKLDGRFGTGTAEFRGDPKHVKVRVVDVRDQNGEPVNASKDMKSDLRDQAIDFIPRA